MKQLFLLSTIVMSMFSQTGMGQDKKWNLFVGTYTRGKSEGIYTYSFDPATGHIMQRSVAKGIGNPSFLAFSPGRGYLYAIHEMEGGAVSAYRIAPSGALTLLNTVATRGANSCYVSVDASGRRLVSGNYSGGNLSVHSIRSDGTLSDSQQVIQHTGKGPHTERQEAPHVHATDFTPDGKFLLVCDLGTDELVAYPYDPSLEKPLDEGKRIVTKVSPGSGPRHIAFHPRHSRAYVITELAGKVMGFDYDKGKLKLFQEITILPEGFTGSFTAAEVKISPDGKFLYASNRGGVNEIVVFSIDDKTGRLSYVERVPSGGKTPRFFEIDPDGAYLFCANQGSDQITVFSRDATTGKLTDTGKRIDVGSPTCILFAPEEK